MSNHSQGMGKDFFLSVQEINIHFLLPLFTYLITLQGPNLLPYP